MSNVTKLRPPLRRERPSIRYTQVIDAALRVAAVEGAHGLVRDRIAEEAGISSSLLHRYFGSMDLLREKVIEVAFQRADTAVLYKSLSIEDFKKLNSSATLAEDLCRYIKGTL